MSHAAAPPTRRRQLYGFACWSLCARWWRVMPCTAVATPTKSRATNNARHQRAHKALYCLLLIVVHNTLLLPQRAPSFGLILLLFCRSPGLFLKKKPVLLDAILPRTIESVFFALKARCFFLRIAFFPKIARPAIGMPCIYSTHISKHYF